MEIFSIVAFGIFGLIIGSFLNVVILRMNTGKGIGGRSHCFSCNKTLRWYELIPVFSFLVQGGKCRRCKSRISWQYPIVELVTGLLFAGIAFRFDLLIQPVTVVLWLVLASVGVVIAAYDVRHKTLPAKALAVFFLISLALGMHLLAMILVPLPFLVLWAVSQGKWIGFGDVELMACIGALLGVAGGYSSVILSFWVACLVILPWFGIRTLRGLKTNHEIPFGPFLLIGIVLVTLCGLNLLTLVGGVVH